MISDNDERRLLDLARRALESRVRGTAPPAREHGGSLDTPSGAFVTIHHRGDLRGCLGRLDDTVPAAENVAELAAEVADSDPRFAPVHAAELPDIDIEISLLTPAHEIASIAEIEVGRHGLIVEDGFQRGLLLPQVATEQAWDRQTFVEHTCIKAGLPRDAWQHGARVLTFEARVFGEKE